MQIIEHTVTPNDTLFSLCNEYNVTPEIIVNSNIMKYPRLIEYPFMIFQNWVLRIPLINNGGDTEYDIR